MPSTTSTARKTPTMRALKTTLRSLLNMFQDICGFVDKLNDVTSANQVTVRLEKLDELWEKVNDVILEIETHDEFTEEDEVYIKQRSEFGSKYYDMKSVLLDKVKDLEEPQTLNQSTRSLDTTQQPTIEHVKLPQIKLQTFDGNIDEWLSFRDLYTSLIHWKTDLPDVEKFHYLKGCLAGEAKALVDPLAITRANYQIAWDTLTKRYNDSKQLKRRQVQALFKLPKLTKESAVELQSLLEGFERTIQTLDQLVQPAEYKDLLLLDILCSRLDPATRRSWEEFSSMKEQDTIKELTEFLQRKVKVLGCLPVKSSEMRSETLQPKRNPLNQHSSYSTVQFTGGHCAACSENHLLYQCPVFQRMSITDRDQVLRANALCRNCFKRGHRAMDCPSRFVCRNCKGKHHTLVCFRPSSNEDRNGSPIAQTSAAGSSIPSSEEVQESSHMVSSNVSGNRISSVLLATAIVLVEGEDGNRIPARALLDSGSECNFMTEHLSQQLKVQRHRSDISVLGIGQASTKVKQKVTVTVTSRVSGFARRMEFLLLPKVTSNLPIANVHMAGWEVPAGVELADPAFFTSKTVDLVLGIQHFFTFFNTGNEVLLGDGLPSLNESVFGWVVSGCIDKSSNNNHITCNMAIGLEELLTRFWSCEEIEFSNKYSPDEARCEEQYVQSVQRGSDGRYKVSLPKDEAAFGRLGESKDIAYRRFLSLERRLLKDSNLRNQYHQFMEEYLELGHMRKVHADSEEHNHVHCYLPHHPVIKEESTTTKVRVVFDASCKTSTGTSLNDTLLAGPVIQDDLRSIILRSRTRQIMVIADVEKMFRQIGISDEDAPLQSILWRTDPSAEISTYELTTVTYGTKPAPFLATRTLKQLALDEQACYPIAAQTATEDVYMDDVLGGADDPEVALELRTQLDGLTQKGGFRLRKWAYNCPLVLQGIPEEDLAIVRKEGVQLDPDPAVRTLGLVWHPTADILKFRFKIPELDSKEILTKRKVLSIIATLFDPLGLIGPVITTAKIFMQLLWCLEDEKGKKLEWDHPLTPVVDSEWRSFHMQLSQLNKLTIERCVIKPKAVNIELHIFSDASVQAYGACAYMRSVDSSGSVGVILLTSKSKVAPLKCQSVPRLELCGALMAAQLSEKVLEAIKMDIEVIFWTDSTCALQWIKAIPSTWTTFVANRVAKIQGLSENRTWCHVPGNQNPADVLSRGLKPDQIQRCNLWWEGPPWLQNGRESWPTQSVNSIKEDVEKEGRRTTAHISNQQEEFSSWYVQMFSNFIDMVRRTAYWLRLTDILRKIEPSKRRYGALQTAELREAERAIIRCVQQDSFKEEWKVLSEGGMVARGSPLRWFHPNLAQDNLIRVGGRLGLSSENEETKHPIVLPARHPFTRKLLEYYHQKLLHAGPQLLLGTVRLQYWPLGGRSVVREVVHQCNRCFRVKPKTVQQFMGELPTARVTISRPFSSTGVDYFGPVHVRTAPRRTAVKAYVAVFVCMCTKAVHLELVTDLSTDRFLQALRRFIGRRGKCTDIYSDNGTNFVGARNQLKQLFDLLKNQEHHEKIAKECTKDGIQWHFNPPSAPHFGGLWEAAVRSAKHHLLRVLGDHVLSLEDMATLLVQIEACLNSRPLTAMSDDPHDLEPLTPGHFLIGTSLQQLPDPNFTSTPLNRLSQWQIVQKKLQEFWKRWRLEYLSQLQGRTKRWRPAVPISVGQLVVIRDDNMPPIRWKMGRIEELHPGRDGVVRVVTVRTATGTMDRAVEKLCILPSSVQEVPTKIV